MFAFAAFFPGESADGTAPVFASSSYTDGTQTLAATISETNPNRLYWALVTNPSTPTAAQIVAGTGGGILEAGNESYSGGFSGTISVTNEAGDEIHLVATDIAGNRSAVEIVTGVTVDSTAPAYSSSVPADNATSISVSSTIAITFSENVVGATSGGEFYLYDDIDTTPVLVETFDVDAGTGSNGGTIAIATDTVTLTPGANMDASAQHSVRWNAGAVEDAYGNGVAANTGDTTLNFTTAAAPSWSITAGDGEATITTAPTAPTAPTVDSTGDGEVTLS